MNPISDSVSRRVEGARLPRPWFSASPMATTMAFVQDRSHSQKRMAELGEGERQLGWFVLPPFQRPPVWSEAQKVRFIESAWNGLPIGAFVLNRPDDLTSPYYNWLLDGQQRVTAVLEYMADAFPVMGYSFSELGEVDLRRWDMSVSFPCMMTSLTDRDALFEIYDRLAYGGTPHEPKA